MAVIRAYSELRTRNTVIRLDLTELEKLISESPKRAEKIIRATAFQAEGYIKQNAAVDTSAMMNSVHVKTKDFDGSSQAIAAAKSARPKVTIADFPSPSDSMMARVGPAVDYAIYQEFGTSRMPAHPFVIPGIEQARDDFLKAWPDMFK